MKKIIALITSLVLCFTLLTACNGNSGLEMTSFTLIEDSVTKSYTVGDTVDFSGIKVDIKYNDSQYDKQLKYSDLTLEFANNLTATKGEKTVKVKYNDPIVSGKVRELTFKVQVYLPAEEMVNYEVLSYTDPVSYTNRKNVISKAGTAAYGDAQYSGQFFNNQDTTYYVGDDNNFKFIPQLTILNDESEDETLPNFISSVKVSLKVENAYVKLNSSLKEGYVYDYSYENNVLVTVDTKNNTYQFAKDGSAVDKEFKIEVVPADFYNYDGTKISTLEIKVIDAFNIYNAKELSVIDNMQSNPNGDASQLKNAWVTIKESLGILGVNVNGVVLHDDINIIEDDIPDAFFNVAQRKAVYSDGIDNNVADVTVEKGDKVLKDVVFLYERQSATDFVFQGNYYTIDISNLPLVGSEAVFNEGSDLGYGSDFSNSSLFRFDGVIDECKVDDFTTNPDENLMMNVNVSNVQFIGNASRNELCASIGEGEKKTDYLLSAGGLILAKTRKGDITFTNVLQNSFFIAYLADSIETYNTRNVVTLNYVKCYDSYQNAGFVWNNAEINVSNSNIENSGGPLFILQHSTDLSNKGLTGIPELKVDENSTLISMLNGGELWFTTVDAVEKVAGIKALSQVLKGLSGNTKTYLNGGDTGKINIVAISMGAGGIDGLTNSDAKSKVSIGDFTMDRSGSEFWNSILTNGLFGQGAPVFGNGILTADDYAALAFLEGNFLYDYSNIGSHFSQGLVESNYVSLYQGGLGAVLGLSNV